MNLRALMAPLLALTAMVGALGVAPAHGASDARGVILLGGRVLLPDGTLREAAVVALRDGRVQRVGDPADFADEPVKQLPAGAVICPGLTDLFATPGAVGQTVEDAEAVDAQASPLSVLEPHHADFRAALEAGITSVMVAPTPTNLVSGVAVTVRTHPDPQGGLDIVRRDGPLLLAFGEGVWQENRRPTSRAGAVQMLQGLLEQSRQDAADPHIHALLAGDLDACCVCPQQVDLLMVRQLLGDVAPRVAWVHSEDLVEVAGLLSDAQRPVVVGPYGLETSRRELMGAAALADAHVEVAFRGGYPTQHPQALRLTAALSVRHGLDAAAARRALTLGPARVAGVAGRLGSIEAGKDADLVVFSQDPLRLDARVLEVYVRGHRVYAASDQNMSTGGGRP